MMDTITSHTWKTVAITLLIIVGIYLFYASAHNIGSGSLHDTGEKTAAVIPLEGTITASSGGYGTNTIQPEDIRNIIEQTEENNIAGYLFTINSGGGSVVATKELARAIADIDKPTVCLMRDVAASGALWAATECDHIVADSLTMTGSIGVTRTYLEVSDLLQEYGIDYINLTAGKYKDTGTPYANLTDEERTMLEKQLKTAHNAFKQQIQHEREINKSTIDEIGQGQILLGKQAANAGLIDTLGGRNTAINALENMTDTNITTKSYKPGSDFSILSILAKKVGEGIGYAITASEEAKGIQAVRDTVTLQ